MQIPKEIVFSHCANKMSYLEVFKEKIDLSRYPDGILEQYLLDENVDESFDNDKSGILSSILGVDINKFIQVEHHRSHAAYSYYASSFR